MQFQRPRCPQVEESTTVGQKRRVMMREFSASRIDNRQWDGVAASRRHWNQAATGTRGCRE